MPHQDDDKQEPAFKVVDRRRFDDSGVERKEPANHQVSTSIPQQPASSDAASHYQRPQMSFSLFVQTLAHQAIMGLGLVPWPDSGLIKKDLAMAKETIDILLMLKEKTLNNLSTEEQSMFEGLIYQLQLAFVEVSREPAITT